MFSPDVPVSVPWDPVLQVVSGDPIVVPDALAEPWEMEILFEGSWNLFL